MNRSSHKVLIVDDDPALLKMVGVYLTRAGFQVETASTTDGAWRAVESARGDFGAVMIDATMAGLSAENLALRLLSASAELRVVIASGYPVDMGRLEAAAPGRARFVQKPFTAETLAGTLRRMLGSQEEDV